MFIMSVKGVYGQIEPKEPKPFFSSIAPVEIEEPIEPECADMDNFEIKEPVEIEPAEPVEPVYNPRNLSRDIYEPDLRTKSYKEPNPSE